MSDQMNMVILAAGKGTRLKIDTPKPLLTALGKPLVEHVCHELLSFTKNNNLRASLNFVVGHAKEQVESFLESKFSAEKPSFSWQKEQLGTGHALQVFFENNPNAWNSKYTLVACTDTPLLRAEIYTKLLNHLTDEKLDAVAATFKVQDPKGLGRVERGERGFKIIEEKDATENQRLISEVNSAVYIFKTETIKKKLSSLSSDNKSSEFYLTDIFSIGDNVMPILFEKAEDFLGVNTLIELERAQKILSSRKKTKLALAGVRFYDSATTYVESDVEVLAGAVIHPGVCLYGKTKIGSDCIIENGVILRDSQIGAGTRILANSYIEKAQIDENCSIGPMARIREGSIIKDECRIGNFVETKKVELHKGVKVSHLSYVGDAEIGTQTNIGCGFITCNYDGAKKHKTKIGSHSFIGSDCQMIAPITIGDEVFIGSGSTINKNVPDKAFAIAREKQVIKEDKARLFLKKK